MPLGALLGQNPGITPAYVYNLDGSEAPALALKASLGHQDLVIRDAYGFTLASEYNGRALPNELFLSGGKLESISRSPGLNAWVERRLEA